MQNSTLLQFCYYLEHTPLNAVIQNNFWIVPTMQSLHILAIASLLIGALLINLRILGFRGQSETITMVIKHYQALIWFALPILFITGSIMIVGEPARSLTNWTFQLKMAMLIAAMLITLHLQRKWDNANSYIQADASSKFLAILSLILWASIVAAGRWIAYTE